MIFNKKNHYNIRSNFFFKFIQYNFKNIQTYIIFKNYFFLTSIISVELYYIYSL